jgi:hypothetical protein
MRRPPTLTESMRTSPRHSPTSAQELQLPDLEVLILIKSQVESAMPFAAVVYDSSSN